MKERLLEQQLKTQKESFDREKAMMQEQQDMVLGQLNAA